MISQNKSFMQTFFESGKRSLIFFSFLWIVAAIFVNPIGEFPLNDDGLYSHWPLSLMEGTNNDLQGALAPNLILQALWAYFFCELFDGFSFTALRFSTLFLGWMCIFIIFIY